jgi:YegS/Rv2252/BmrU family lipid kinase
MTRQEGEKPDSGQIFRRDILSRLAELLGIVDLERLREQGTRYRRLHVIINPASGQGRPILNTLNTIFEAVGVEWDVSITHRSGDARRQAGQAAASGVDAVAAYGGDGTVMEVAAGLAGTGIPLAIFPGGTANVLAMELGIPWNLIRAAALVCGEANNLRTVDMGRAGDRAFFHLGIGLQAEMVKGAPRELKDRIGTLAYVGSALRELRNPTPSRYRLTLDGQQVEMDGVVCTVTNFGSVGLRGVSLGSAIDLSDGLLDVIVVRSADLEFFLSMAGGLIAGANLTDALPHWQAREIAVQADPPQTVSLDGEIIEPTPVSAHIMPKAVRIIVPDTDRP